MRPDKHRFPGQQSDVFHQRLILVEPAARIRQMCPVRSVHQLVEQQRRFGVIRAPVLIQFLVVLGRRLAMPRAPFARLELDQPVEDALAVSLSPGVLSLIPGAFVGRCISRFRFFFRIS